VIVQRPSQLPEAPLWKTFRFQTERRSGGQQNCSPSHRNRCSTSERNTVRNHNGMAFDFSPESRSPSTGIASQKPQ
jgi:hypothetical protein